MKIHVRRKPNDSYQHGDLRQALIQAGLKLLTEGGASKLSLRAAAQLAGVSHAAPYRHFADKDTLVAAIAEEGFRLLTAHMRAEAARARPGNTVDHLRALGFGYLDFAVQHPSYLHVIFGGVATSARKTPALAAAGDEAYQTLRSAVAAGVARGELVAGNVDTLALACWSMMHGLGMLVVDGALPRELCEQVAAREAAHTLTQLLYDGMRARKKGG
jgi:AcrR family transcriptional regulator